MDLLFWQRKKKTAKSAHWFARMQRTGTCLSDTIEHIIHRRSNNMNRKEAKKSRSSCRADDAYGKSKSAPL